MVFSRPELRRYVGVRGGPVPLTRRQRACRICSQHAASWSHKRSGVPGVVPRLSRTPEGGDTTQSGDPAPGPTVMRNHASGDERMHQ